MRRISYNHKKLPSFQRCVIVSIIIGQLFFLIQSWTFLSSSSKDVDDQNLIINDGFLQKQNNMQYNGHRQNRASESNEKEVSSVAKKESTSTSAFLEISGSNLSGNGPIAEKTKILISNAHQVTQNEDDPDRECIFRNSTIYRSIFVYPSPGEPEWVEAASAKEKTGVENSNILTEYGKSRTSLYPWQIIDNRTKTNGEYHYSIRDSRAIQYTLEILVREIITNPKSCLRTYDPSQAKLFYIPYMPSIEWHNGTQYPKSFATSPYGQALMDVIDKQNYTLWETNFGLTSKYWKLKNGADHILVMSEPNHGLWHPRNSRKGNYIYLHAQKQLAPPIIISKEISQTFVQTYPKCSARNIIMPHPNTDGRWFNSKTETTALSIAEKAGMLDLITSPAALQAEKKLARMVTNNNNSEALLGDSGQQINLPRVMAQFYKAGNHGACYSLRRSMEIAYLCSQSNQLIQQKMKKLPRGYSFPHAYRQATFCPCPGGDTPSAKRMFDALFAGCIPIILSRDFVWPFTKEVPGSVDLLNPEDFSIRLIASEYTSQGTIPKEGNDCASNQQHKTVQAYLEKIPAAEIQRLRHGGRNAARVYSFYLWSKSLPNNLLQANVLPNGGAAMALVSALADRAEGRFSWSDCQEELKLSDPSQDNVSHFKC